MKDLKKLDEFKNLDKNQLVEELMKSTIKGGCCQPTTHNGRPDRIIFY